MAKSKTKNFLPPVKQKSLNALNEIRDRCLLLILANEYLCEKVFLFRMGIAIESYVEALRSDIIALKKRFPGKFLHEIDTDKMVNDIKVFAESLKKADKETKRKCMSNQLGKELEEKLNLLSKAIQNIREQVEGASVTYSAQDSFSGLFRWLKSTISWFWSSTTFLAKILSFTLFILAIALYTLFWTIENEEVYQEGITKAGAIIEMQKKIIAETNDEKKVLIQKMEILQGKDGDVDRNEKLEILTLTLDLEKLDQKQNKAIIEIDVQKKKIEENYLTLEKIRKQTFWQRLFRM